MKRRLAELRGLLLECGDMVHSYAVMMEEAKREGRGDPKCIEDGLREATMLRAKIGDKVRELETVSDWLTP